MSSDFWQAVGALIDHLSAEDPRPTKDIFIVEDPRPRTVVIGESTPVYREVYPLIKRESFDREKAAKAAKYFAANKAVNLDDLLKCLKAMDFDSGRGRLVQSLRRPIAKMGYFERMEIADTFDWTSGIPGFIND